jgi:hypothetical protein
MAAGLREAIGAPLSATARAELDQYVASLLRTLSPASLDAAMADGRRTPLDVAIAYASEK